MKINNIVINRIYHNYFTTLQPRVVLKSCDRTVQMRIKSKPLPHIHHKVLCSGICRRMWYGVLVELSNRLKLEEVLSPSFILMHTPECTTHAMSESTLDEFPCDWTSRSLWCPKGWLTSPKRPDARWWLVTGD